MSGKIVLDSSVIAALFFREELSDTVEEIVEGYQEYYTVSQAYSEVANVAWKRIKIHGEDEEISKQALKNAIEFIERICEVVDNKLVLNQAFELAVKYGVTVYDALFIALAIKLEEKLITTDRRLYNMIRSTDLERFVECVEL